MEEFFGAKFCGFTKESKTYITPDCCAQTLLEEFSKDSPMPINYALPIFNVKNKEYVKGVVALPYTDPADSTNYASIHSNPPGKFTNYPAIMIREYGKGKVFWIAGAIEQDDRTCFRKVFKNILDYLVGKNNYSFNAKLSKTVELISYKTEKGFIFNFIDLVNYEDDLTKEFYIEFASESSPSKIEVLPSDINVKQVYENGLLKLFGNIKNYGTIKVDF